MKFLSPNQVNLGRVIRMLADRKTMAIVLVEQYLVMERGEGIACGRGKDIAADGARQKISI